MFIIILNPLFNIILNSLRPKATKDLGERIFLMVSLGIVDHKSGHFHLIDGKWRTQLPLF